MMQITQPDFFIHIGIKDKKIISTNWGEMLLFEGYINTNEQTKEQLIEYLKQAIKSVQSVPII